MDFKVPSCLTTGVCTNCGGCAFRPPVIEPGKKDEYDPSKAPGQVAAVLWDTPGVATFYTGGKLHQPTVVTYSFSGLRGADMDSDSWLKGLKAEWGVGSRWIEFTAGDKAAIAKAAAVISSLTGIELIYIEDSTKADMVWHYGDMNNLQSMTSAFNPQNIAMGSDIIVNTNYSLFFETLDKDPGGKGFGLLLHEFGHAIGMKHPFFGAYQLALSAENRGVTVMSHTEDPNGTYTTKPKSLDIEALNYIYGTYSDKMEGVSWSQLEGGGLISTGTSANDTISGIADKDFIDGADGNDVVFAGGGDDTITSGEGTNIIFGGSGIDYLKIDRLFADSTHYQMTVWRDARESGGFSGVFQSEGRTEFFSGINGFSFIDKAVISTPNLIAQASNADFISSAFRLIYNSNPTSMEMAANLKLLNSLSRADLVDKLLDTAALSAPGQPATDIASLVSIISSRSAAVSASDALMSWAVSTSDITGLIVTLASQPQATSIYQIHDTTYFSALPDALYQKVSSIASYAAGTASVNLLDIIDAANSVHLKGKSLSDVATDFIIKFNAPITASQLLQNIGLIDTTPIADIHDLAERDGSLGFTLKSEGKAIGFVRSYEINDVKFADGKLIINKHQYDSVSFDVTEKVALLDGVILTGHHGFSSALLHIYEAFTGKTATNQMIEAMRNLASSGISYQDAVALLPTVSDFSDTIAAYTKNLSNSNFSKALYRQLFGEEASEFEANSLTSLLSDGRSRGDVAISLASGASAEERLVAPDGGFVWLYDKYSAIADSYYDGAFNRLPDQIPGTGYAELIKLGLDVSVLSRIFSNSAELAVMQRAQLDNSDFIRSQFQYSLDRQPTEAEFQYWNTAVNNKFETRSTLLTSLADQSVRSKDLFHMTDDYRGVSWNAASSPTDKNSSTGNDMLYADRINDELVGGAGNDTLQGGSGDDTLDGGVGIDTAYFHTVASALRIRDAGGGVLFVEGGPLGTDRLTGIERIQTQDSSIDLLADMSNLFRTSDAGDSYMLLGQSYAGPVAGLDRKLFGSQMSEVFAGTARSDFMNLFAGDDAANGGAGNDVLDGGLGSNFLSGGTGKDTFFLDGRGGGVTWATITDWEAGEQLSLWGWRPGVSKALWVDQDGVGAFRGVTMHGDLNGDGVFDTSVTWSGMTRAELPTPLEFDGLLWFIG